MLPKRDKLRKSRIDLARQKSHGEFILVWQTWSASNRKWKKDSESFLDQIRGKFKLLIPSTNHNGINLQALYWVIRRNLWNDYAFHWKEPRQCLERILATPKQRKGRHGEKHEFPKASYQTRVNLSLEIVGRNPELYGEVVQIALRNAQLWSNIGLLLSIALRNG